eukprot:scaffold123711_cov51-Phaeocystis_antarctica.AAC.1
MPKSPQNGVRTQRKPLGPNCSHVCCGLRNRVIVPTGSSRGALRLLPAPCLAPCGLPRAASGSDAPRPAAPRPPARCASGSHLAAASGFSVLGLYNSH